MRRFRGADLSSLGSALTKRPIPPDALARLLDQAGRTMHSRGFHKGLFPAQWTALRYFATAAPGARTASALARFQGLAVGPVTRTVRTLMAKGYLENFAGQGRGRARRVDLTPAGAALLAEDPLRPVAAAMDELRDEERLALATALELVLQRLGQGSPGQGLGEDPAGAA